MSRRRRGRSHYIAITLIVAGVLVAADRYGWFAVPTLPGVDASRIAETVSAAARDVTETTNFGRRGSTPAQGQQVQSAITQPPPPAATGRTFRQAKADLERYVYNTAATRVTIYCGCRYSERKAIDVEGCGLSDSLGSRVRRVEWEHALPAAAGAMHWTCYREPQVKDGGRRPNGTSARTYCADTDPSFAAYEAEMSNLWPSVGAVNLARSNHRYGMVPGERREFGSCDFEDDGSVAEPRESVRGDVARSALFMSDRYGIRLSSRDRQLYEAWNRQDPPDAWERERNARIKRIQGYGNPYISR